MKIGFIIKAKVKNAEGSRPKVVRQSEGASSIHTSIGCWRLELSKLMRREEWIIMTADSSKTWKGELKATEPHKGIGKRLLLVSEETYMS